MHSGHLSVLPFGILLYKPLTESTTCSISPFPLRFSCDSGSNHQPPLNTGKGDDSHMFQGNTLIIVSDCVILIEICMYTCMI